MLFGRFFLIIPVLGIAGALARKQTVPAATLRQTRSETTAHRRRVDGTIDEVASSALTVGDECVVSAGEVIPGDGDVIEGIATVDESAITGESAPVIREPGGDRSAVTGGTRGLSDRIVVRISARPGETFLDRMIALGEGGHVRRKLEPDSSRPRYFITEPGMGYRFESGSAGWAAL